ncbi:hypothetical protein HC928_00145 [bacterium]|nr:hypothetical protein [bacterium]
MKITFEDQATGRYRLVISAKTCKKDSFSIQEWLDDDEVQSICKQYELEQATLEHIAYWVWQPIKGETMSKE